MKLLFKERAFSWFDSYDIYDEKGDAAFSVEGQPAWGHRLQIYDKKGALAGIVKEVILSWTPRFELYDKGDYIGCIRRKYTPFKPTYTVDFKGWNVLGDVLAWNYVIYDGRGHAVASVGKEVFEWTDTYVIDVKEEQDALYCLMFTLAIDAEKSSRS